MKFTFTCKKISLNDSVKAYAEKKIGKLEKYFKEEPEATVTFAVEKKNRCIVEVMLRGANGTLFRAVCEDADGDMRGAIDEAVGQIDRKIRKNISGHPALRYAPELAIPDLNSKHRRADLVIYTVVLTVPAHEAALVFLWYPVFYQSGQNLSLIIHEGVAIPLLTVL